MTNQRSSKNASSSGNSDEKFEKMWANAEIKNSKLYNKSRSITINKKRRVGSGVFY